MHAEIYSKPSCPHCVQAKMLLDRNEIPYTEISAVDNRDALIERVTAATGSAPRTVPQIFIDGHYIGGHDDLVKRFFK